jgi:anti-anti-sigma factor
VVRVSVVGALDRETAAALDRVLRSGQSEGATTVLDLDEVTGIDVVGAGTLRAAASEARQHGHPLIAVNGSPEVEQSLRLMGLDRQLTLVAAR